MLNSGVYESMQLLQLRWQLEREKSILHLLEGYAILFPGLVLDE